MKTGYRILAVFFPFLFIAGPNWAAVHVHPAKQGEEIAGVDEGRLEKTKAKLERNNKKYEKRLHRFERKMKKRGLVGEDHSQEVWDDDKFRLGVLLLLVAIGLGILGAIIRLGGLFGFMAGLFALGGVILLIWSLVEYYG